MTKHDNSNPAAKIALRKLFIECLDRPKILECYAGQQRVMFRACYQGHDVTALDLKGGPGVKKVDNRPYVRRHADEYNYFDLDAYGSPYPLLVTLFANRRSPDPFAVVVTDGSRLRMNYQHASRIETTAANLPAAMSVPGLVYFQDEIIGYVLRAAAARYGVEITGAKIVTGDTGNMKYFGFIARKK